MNDLVTSQPVMEGNMPLALAIYFNADAFDRATAIALKMSKADGFTPQHLIGKPDACFAVVEISLTWKLSPFQVAKATYRTPGGSIGFEGKLIQAIIENSGHLEPGSGGVHFEHYGDWTKIQGKFTKRKSEKGNEYSVATWTDDDAIKGGAGVRVSAHLRGEAKARELRFDLVQAQPRNSTLWATDAKTQLCYTAVRRFGSVVVPGLLMGVPFDEPFDVGERDMGDIQPEPEIIQPRPKAISGEALVSAAKAAVETLDEETGEVTYAPAAPEQAPPPPADGGGGAPSLITQAALRILNQKLQDRDLTEQYCAHFGVADPSETPMSRVNEAMTWVSTHGKGA